MTTSRTIRPENWLALSTRIYTVFGDSVDSAVVAAIRNGSPSESDIATVRARALRVRSQTYNGAVFHQCNSILETLDNYGL